MSYQAQNKLERREKNNVNLFHMLRSGLYFQDAMG